MKLTIKQENFCNYYVECGNASEAYRRAYSCDRMKPGIVNRKAKELMDNGKIAARVKELQNERKEQSDITKEKILSELSNIAFSSIAHLHNTWIERKDFELLTEKQKSSIKSISTKILKKNVGTNEDPEIIDVEYVKIELYDKIKAIERICKMLGYDEPTVLDLRNALVQIDTGID
ncbi:terminase small subunit [Parabacteroides sp. AF48-14]|uniref:terminase small subunit n=1 Tax=Parabacteroides sp. AF48-14 TaxID=2292052 RepID=UPI000EFFE635|nr:terminase small subunit [Parabacteroides sp. AF48-14]